MFGGGIRVARLCAIFLALATIAVGCGSDDSTGGSSTESGGVTIEAKDGKDRQMAIEVKDYFDRNCPTQASIDQVSEKEKELFNFPAYKRIIEGAIAMCENVTAIAVEGGVVTVRSDLPGGTNEKLAGDAYCLEIQGSDVADFTPGHELQDGQGETVKVCPARDG